MRLYNFTGWLLLILMFVGLDALRFEPEPMTFGAVAADTVTYGDKRIVYKVTLDTSRNRNNDLRWLPDLSNAPTGANYRMITDTSAFDSALLVTGDTFAMSPLDSSTAVTVASNWGYGDPYEVTLAWHDTATGPDPLQNFAAAASHDTLRSSWGSTSDSVRIFSGLNAGGQEDTFYVAGNSSPHDRVVTVEGSYFSCGNAYTTQATGDYSDNRCDNATIDTTGGGGGAGDYPNEPIDFVELTSRGFSAFEEDGWLNFSGGNYTVAETDADAPISPSDVGQMKFPSGMEGGVAPGHTNKSHAQASEIYFAFPFKISDNWHGHSSGVNKILFIAASDYGGGGAPATLSAHGADDGNLSLQMRLFGPGIERSEAAGPNIGGNVGDATVARNTWIKIEVHMVANTGSNADGELHIWMNETKTHEYTDVRYFDESADPSDHKFNNMRWNPTWGGVGDTVPATQYQWIDDFYISAPS